MSRAARAALVAAAALAVTGCGTLEGFRGGEETIAAVPMPPAATACHECAGVPGTHVAVRNPMVGTTQLTSPTSVDPMPRRRPIG